MTPHWPIHCTALAAALGTLGVALDPLEPYDRVIDTESGRERLQFLFREASETDATRKTQDIVTAWENRRRFEADFPTHPLVYMRAAHDARTALVKIVHGAHVPPVREFAGDKLNTPHLCEAAILKAHGFPLLVFTGRAFSFPARWKAFLAREVLERSQRPVGDSAAQWQARYLVNLGKFLAAAKGSPILAEREDNKTLLLSADADKKTRDYWHDLFSE